MVCLRVDICVRMATDGMPFVVLVCVLCFVGKDCQFAIRVKYNGERERRMDREQS